MCSNLSVRSVFTSEILYNENSFPKEMSFKLPSQKDKYLDHYEVRYFPESLVKDYELETIRNNEKNLHKLGVELKQEKVSPF